MYVLNILGVFIILPHMCLRESTYNKQNEYALKFLEILRFLSNLYGEGFHMIWQT